MSQRSIIEVNHDCSHLINARSADEFVPLLMRALGSGSEETWEPLRKFGIRRIVQVHHSTDRKVTISGPGWEKEYPIP